MKKRFQFLALLILCAAAALPRGDKLPWQDDYAKTLAEAADKHQPVFLNFFAPWCGPCRMMDTTTLADAGTREQLKGYLLVKIDFDQNPDLAAKYHIESVPTCIVLNQFGEKVDGRDGYIAAPAFAAWIHQCEDSAFARESQAESQRMAVQRAVARLESSADTDRAGSGTFFRWRRGGVF